MNTQIIPKGIYCYDENGICPYFSQLKIYDKLSFVDTNDNPLPPISFPYCTFLKKGSMPNGEWKNNELQRLGDHLHQTENELWDDILSLDLLWDQCKECGVNNDNDDIDLKDIASKLEGRVLFPEAVKHAKEYLHKAEMSSLYKKALEIYESDIEWEEKYDKIFSDEISKKAYDFFTWYDPDTSYEEDVVAFMNAFKDYVEDVYK